MHAGLGCRVVGLASLALLSVDRADLNDAPPTFLHHVGRHLLGDVEHAGQVGVDDGIPFLARHLHEHAVPRDARIVHQHINGPMLGLGLGKGVSGGLPVGHISGTGVESEAIGLLLIQPFLVVAAGAATSNDLEPPLMQAAADGGSNAPHTPGHIGDFLAHGLSPLVMKNYENAPCTFYKMRRPDLAFHPTAHRGKYLPCQRYKLLSSASGSAVMVPTANSAPRRRHAKCVFQGGAHAETDFLYPPHVTWPHGALDVGRVWRHL